MGVTVGEDVNVIVEVLVGVVTFPQCLIQI